LQLAKNEFESIIKVNESLELRILNLKSNKITKIEANSFNGLLNLKLINLLNNSINEIDSNGFNNTNFKEIRLSIPNMSIEMIKILNYSLNPNLAYKNWIYDYYDSIYVENRQDIDCFKMFFLIKFKVFYNFINDNNDVNYVTSPDCLNLTKVRDKLNQFNDSFHHLNYITIDKPPTDNLTYQLVTWIIFSVILLILTLNFIRCLINKNKKINKIMHNAKEESNKIQDERVNKVDVSETFCIQQAQQEEINGLNEILNLEEQINQD